MAAYHLTAKNALYQQIFRYIGSAELIYENMKVQPTSDRFIRVSFHVGENIQRSMFSAGWDVQLGHVLLIFHYRLGDGIDEYWRTYDTLRERFGNGRQIDHGTNINLIIKCQSVSDKGSTQHEGLFVCTLQINFTLLFKREDS